jgi:hypothetical protein
VSKCREIVEKAISKDDILHTRALEVLDLRQRKFETI